MHAKWATRVRAQQIPVQKRCLVTLPSPAHKRTHLYTHTHTRAHLLSLSSCQIVWAALTPIHEKPPRAATEQLVVVGDKKKKSCLIPMYTSC